MYDQVYERMVFSGAAVNSTELIYYNINSEIVNEGDPSEFGMGIHYYLEKPHLVFHFDETGQNASQVKDGRLAGEKYIIPQGEKT